MAIKYAGVLGALGMAVALLRGVIAGGGMEGTIGTSLMALVVLAPVGLVVGWIAQLTIDDSVRTRILQQMAELKKREEDATAVIQQAHAKQTVAEATT